MSNYVGIDPDLRILTIAWVNENKKPIGLVVHKLDVPKTCQGIDLVNAAVKVIPTLYLPLQIEHAVIESQEAYNTFNGRKINANDLINLATVSGAWAGRLGLCELVLPKKWKGTTPKAIAQSRVWGELGIPHKKMSKSAVPTSNLDVYLDVFKTNTKMNSGIWSDVADSFGLALYAVKSKSRWTAKCV